VSLPGVLLAWLTAAVACKLVTVTLDRVSELPPDSVEFLSLVGGMVVLFVAAFAFTSSD